MAGVTCDMMRCSSFVDKANRQLWRSWGADALAYNLGNFMRVCQVEQLAGPWALARSGMMNKIIYRGYRFPPEIIQRAIWLYYRFTLSFA
jgi:hypothetical protein